MSQVVKDQIGVSKHGHQLFMMFTYEIFLNYIKDNKTTFGILLCQMETHAFQQGIMNSVQSYIQSIIPGLSDKCEEQYIYSFMMHGCLNIIVNWINNDFNIHSHKLAEIIYHVCNVILAEPVSDAETSTANIK